MKLMFVKSVNCGVNASRRAKLVVIDDAVGKPIRVCLKHVHGCLTKPTLKMDRVASIQFLPIHWAATVFMSSLFLLQVLKLHLPFPKIVEVTSGTIDHEDASSSTPVAVTAVLHLGDSWKHALKLPILSHQNYSYSRLREKRIFQLQWQKIRYF